MVFSAWEYTWPTNHAGEPTAADVTQAIRDDRTGSRYRREILLTPTKLDTEQETTA